MVWFTCGPMISLAISIAIAPPNENNNNGLISYLFFLFFFFLPYRKYYSGFSVSFARCFRMIGECDSGIELRDGIMRRWSSTTEPMPTRIKQQNVNVVLVGEVLISSNQYVIDDCHHARILNIITHTSRIHNRIGWNGMG